MGILPRGIGVLLLLLALPTTAVAAESDKSIKAGESLYEEIPALKKQIPNAQIEAEDCKSGQSCPCGEAREYAESKALDRISESLENTLAQTGFTLRIRSNDDNAALQKQQAVAKDAAQEESRMIGLVQGLADIGMQCREDARRLLEVCTRTNGGLKRLEQKCDALLSESQADIKQRTQNKLSLNDLGKAAGGLQDLMKQSKPANAAKANFPDAGFKGFKNETASLENPVASESALDAESALVGDGSTSLPAWSASSTSWGAGAKDLPVGVHGANGRAPASAGGASDSGTASLAGASTPEAAKSTTQTATATVTGLVGASSAEYTSGGSKGSDFGFKRSSLGLGSDLPSLASILGTDEEKAAPERGLASESGETLSDRPGYYEEDDTDLFLVVGLKIREFKHERHNLL